MCRKLLALVALLGFVSVAPAATMIDDFESYWGTPPLQAVWTDKDAPASTDTAILLTSGVCEGDKAMEWDYHQGGGWVNPGNPTDYEKADHAMIGRTIAAYDFKAGDRIELCIRPYLQDLDKVSEYLLEYSGDGYGQTWIPGYKQINPWWAPHNYPAIIAPVGWTAPAGSAGVTEDTVYINPGQWGKIVITDDMYVGWGQSLVAFNAMTGIGVAVFGNVTDTTAAPKFSGTDTLYPPGSLTGRLDVDCFYFVPEPATIALLGLGGLALLRKKS
jgi:hypothetical protein